MVSMPGSTLMIFCIAGGHARFDGSHIECRALANGVRRGRPVHHPLPRARAITTSGFVRKGIHVAAGDHPVIDIALTVGKVTESVELTSEARRFSMCAPADGHVAAEALCGDGEGLLPASVRSLRVVNHLEVRADYKPGESAAPFS